MDRRNTPIVEPGQFTREHLADAVKYLEEHNTPHADGNYYAAPQPPPVKTITFRNNLTGETITVNDCEAARALAERKRLPRAQRRAQEKGARKLLKKTRKVLLPRT